jgi:hypothetical protein
MLIPLSRACPDATSAASSSMCYRKACTRFATTASGTRLGASTLSEPVSCSCSTVQQQPRLSNNLPTRATAPLIRRLITHHTTRRGSARVVSGAVSLASPAFTPNNQADHDPYDLAPAFITDLLPACSGHATGAPCFPYGSPRFVLPQSPPTTDDYPTP